MVVDGDKYILLYWFMASQDLSTLARPHLFVGVDEDVRNRGGEDCQRAANLRSKAWDNSKELLWLTRQGEMDFELTFMSSVSASPCLRQSLFRSQCVNDPEPSLRSPGSLAFALMFLSMKKQAPPVRSMLPRLAKTWCEPCPQRNSACTSPRMDSNRSMVKLSP